jgi:hypothetical protein
LRAYIELGYSWAWVTEPSAIAREFEDASPSEFKWGTKWDPSFRHNWDFQGRISFQFGSDKKANADTIMGSGDVNTEVSLGSRYGSV